MLPLLIVPALIQTAPTLPPVFAVPQGLRIKEGTFVARSYDQETFEVLKTLEQAPLRVPVRGRAWRFVLESAGVREGIFSLLQRFKPTIVARGWTWQWEQRNVARYQQGDQDYWIKAGPSGGAALQVVIIQPGLPRTLTLTAPGATPEVPAPEEDFPYLTPWPGATLVTSMPPHPGPAVVADLGDGIPKFVGATYIEKQYALTEQPSPFEFITTYRQALEATGWEIEGDFQGERTQIQAIYLKQGRDIRLTLHLIGKMMAVSVADIGAQFPKK